jgi:hypothetical protein
MRALALAVSCSFAVACLEPSGIEDAEEVLAAVARRNAADSGMPEGGSGGSAAGSGGSAAGSGGARAGSGGAGGMPTGGTGGMGSDCGDVVADFIIPTCGSEFCHGAEAASPLHFVPSELPGSLLGTAASATCTGEVYIDPEMPEQSLIYLKMSEDPPCGSPMPLGALDSVDETERACVLEWLTEAGN